jgi:hypothetical protein
LGDFNGDGTVNSEDFDALAENYAMTLAVLSGAIPETVQPAGTFGALVP